MTRPWLVCAGGALNGVRLTVSWPTWMATCGGNMYATRYGARSSLDLESDRLDAALWAVGRPWPHSPRGRMGFPRTTLPSQPQHDCGILAAYGWRGRRRETSDPKVRFLLKIVYELAAAAVLTHDWVDTKNVYGVPRFCDPEENPLGWVLQFADLLEYWARPYRTVIDSGSGVRHTSEYVYPFDGVELEIDESAGKTIWILGRKLAKLGTDCPLCSAPSGKDLALFSTLPSHTNRRKMKKS